MILKNSSYDGFSAMIQETKKKIVVYGAGVLGQVSLPYFLNTYGLSNNVICYVDADIHKQGKEIALYSNSVPVCSPEFLKTIKDDFVLLISNSHCYSVIDFLDSQRWLDSIQAYIFPVMQLTCADPPEKAGSLRRLKDQAIPKQIHYCWFSGNPIPEHLQVCISSWKKYCPDYEIIQWDEHNYDITKNKYMKQAYDKQEWAFIPDIARLDILYQYGGIYLDTDVELIRNLDELLYQPGFCGVEKWGIVNFGGCSGAHRGHPVIKDLLDFRKNESFLNEDGTVNMTSSGFYETIPLLNMGMQLNEKTQLIHDMTIYSSDFFHPTDYLSGELNITENTFSIHHFDGSWQSKTEQQKMQDSKKHFIKLLERMN